MTDWCTVGSACDAYANSYSVHRISAEVKFELIGSTNLQRDVVQVHPGGPLRQAIVENGEVDVDAFAARVKAERFRVQQIKVAIGPGACVFFDVHQDRLATRSKRRTSVQDEGHLLVQTAAIFVRRRPIPER